MKSFKQMLTKVGTRFKSPKFTAVFVGATTLIVAAGTSAALTLHASQSPQETTTTLTTKQTESPAKTQPTSTTSAPSASANASTVTQTSQTAATPAPNPAVKTTTPTAVPAPTPPAPLSHVAPSVTISADGCKVSAVADAGLVLVTGSYKPGHHGGQAAYNLPYGQRLTVSVGGPVGDKSFGEILDATGKVAALVTADITGTCGAADASTAPEGPYPMPPDA